MAQKAGIKTKDKIGKAYDGKVALPPFVADSDIDYAYPYLVSDEPNLVTGEELVVDGGWTTNF